jgi:hypothetical protein
MQYKQASYEILKSTCTSGVLSVDLSELTKKAPLTTRLQ